MSSSFKASIIDFFFFKSTVFKELWGGGFFNVLKANIEELLSESSPAVLTNQEASLQGDGPYSLSFILLADRLLIKCLLDEVENKSLIS